MAPPYVKRSSKQLDDGWEIQDGEGATIAIVATETMANALLATLLGLLERVPDYPSNTPIAAAEECELWLYRCQKCQHEAAQREFWPMDGSPARYICPACGSTKAVLAGETDA